MRKNIRSSFYVICCIAILVIVSDISVVSAQTGNRLINGNFEDGTTAGWRMLSGTIEATEEAAHAGTYGVKVTHDDGVKSNAQSFRQTFDFKAGEWYYLSAYVKAAEDPRGLQATVRIRTSSNLDAFLGDHEDKQYSLSTTEWTHLENIAHVSSDCTSQFYIRAGNDSTAQAYDYYADDLMLCRLTLNETENIPLFGTLVLNGPRELNLTIDKVCFKNGGVVTGVVYNDESKAWEITYTGIPADLENSLVLNLDFVTRQKATPTLDFKSESSLASTNRLSYTIKEYDFENYGPQWQISEEEHELEHRIGNITSIYGGRFSIVDGTEEFPANTGNRYLKYTGRTRENGAHRFNNVTGLEAGKTYIISFYARLAEADTDVTASVYIHSANLNINKFTIDNVCAFPEKGVQLSTQWQKVSAYVSITENTEMDEGVEVVDKGIHIGAQFSGLADVHIDSYEIKELKSFDYCSDTEAILRLFEKNELLNNYTVALDIYNPGSLQQIYFVAVKYGLNGALEDFKYSTQAVNGDELIRLTLAEVDSDYMLYFWDGEFKLLNDKFPVQSLGI